MRGIRLLVSSLTHSARALEQSTGITNAQLFLLRELAASGPLTINQLAERAMTGQNAVSSVVNRLEERRLVTRGRSAEDGRVVTVTSTAAGRRLVDRAPEPPAERLLRALSDLDAPSLRTVTRAVTLLTTRMGIATDAEAGMLFEGGKAETRPARRRVASSVRK